MFSPWATKDAGIAGMGPALASPSSHIVATRDPYLMLRIQAKNFRTSYVPLPMISWWADEPSTRNSWANFNGRTICFWEMDLDYRTILQCARLEGHLVLAGPGEHSGESVGHWLRRYQAIDLSRKLCTKARPWRQGLRQWLRTASEMAAVRLLDNIEEVDSDIAHEARSCVPSTSVLIQRPRMRVRRALVKKQTVSERNGRWYAEGRYKERLMLDGVIRFDKIYLHEDGPNEYVGRLILRDKTLPIHRTEPEACGNRLGKYLTNLTLENLGRPLTLASEPSLRMTALAFHKPEIIRGIDRIGWDGSGWQFKYFRVAENFTPMPPGLVRREVPGLTFKCPRFRNHMVGALSSDKLEMQSFWALVVTALTTALRPVVGRESPKVLVGTPSSPDATVAVLEALGISRVATKAMACGVSSNYPSVRWEHRWPVAVNLRFPFSVAAIYRWLASDVGDQMIPICSDQVTSIMVGTGHFAGVLLAGQLAMLAQLPTSTIIVDYLRWMARREMRLSQKPLWLAVQESVAEWFQEHQGKPDTILRCHELLRLPGATELSYDNRIVREAAAAIMGQSRTISHEELRRKCEIHDWPLPQLEGAPDPIEAGRPSP